MGRRRSHAIHVASVGHLLQIEAGEGHIAAEQMHRCTLQQVLQVPDTDPHVVQICQGVSGRARSQNL